MASTVEDGLSAEGVDDNARASASKRPRFVKGWSQRLRTWAVSGSMLAAAVALWEVISLANVVPRVALPTPLGVLNSFVSLMTTGYQGVTLEQDIGVSAARIGAGFLGAVVLGVPLGILMGRFSVVHRVIDPFVELARPVPGLAYLPLLIVWFGIGELPKFILIVIGTIPVIIINSMGGVRSTPVARLQVAQCLGASEWQLFWRVFLPSALPQIFTGMRVGVGVAWTSLVAAELIAASSGLGWLVEQAGAQLQVGDVIVGVIFIGILGYVMDLVVAAAESAVVPWRGRG